MTLISVFATFTTLINGTIVTTAHEQISATFHISESSFPHSYWLVTSWAIGGGVTSLAVLPLLEDFGVRSGFLWIYVAFVLSIIPEGFAPNYATLLVFRFCTGGCVSILANAAASVIGNIWKDDRDRTIPMSLYITAYIAGISVGPVIGGIIIQHLDWRWVFHLQLIWYSVFFPIYYFGFEETRGSIILGRHADGLADTDPSETGPSSVSLPKRLGISIKRPLYMLFTEPVLFVFTLWSAFAVGTVYLFTQSVEQVFVKLYGWSASQAGYVQTAVVIGACIGGHLTLVSGKFYFASAKRNVDNPGKPIPEARLYVSVFGSVFGVSGGMLLYGWTAYPDDPWIGEAIGLAMVGFGIVLIVLAAADYVVDAYTTYAGSAVAALVLGEDLVAAFLPLAAQKMYTDMGFQWASTTLGLVSLFLSLAPIALIIWGKRIRAHSAMMTDMY